jgi:hypothetical protein
LLEHGLEGGVLVGGEDRLIDDLMLGLDEIEGAEQYCAATIAGSSASLS